MTKPNKDGRWYSPAQFRRAGGRAGWLSVLCALAMVGAQQVRAATETVIRNFAKYPHGAMPYAPLVRDSSGNFYSTTNQGGPANAGVVFKLDSAGQQKVLYSFTGGADGGSPYGGVARDSAGSLYGTTYGGGAAGKGVVYKVSPSGQETVLHSFTGGADGGSPYAGVILDSAGNLYGTTYYGGGTGCTLGCGVVYKVDAAGSYTVLYTFTGGTDGAYPYAGVIRDSVGNLYGTTYLGGLHPANLGSGVVYKLDSSGQQTVLYTFGVPGGKGGAPLAGVIRDPAGNLYGTASDVVYKLDPAGNYTALKVIGNIHGLTGGVVQDAAGNLYGTIDAGQGYFPFGGVFELDATGQYKVLYKFPGGTATVAASGPIGGAILDAAGNLYGTTPYGGVAGMVCEVHASGQRNMLYSFPTASGGTTPVGVVFGPGGELYGATTLGGKANAGVIYKVNATGNETVLYSFTGGADGGLPLVGVVLDSAGNLYGSTHSGGGANVGVVYRLDTAGHYTVLYSFTGGADGGLPSAVILDSAGNLYGTTFEGGAANLGVVYKLDTAGSYTVLHSFTGEADGSEPDAGVVLDSAGNLYGTTFYGGAGAGVVYKMSPSGQETVLHSFTGGADGANPDAGVIRDSAGNLYGTNVNFGPGGGGVVYKLDKAGNYTVLYGFSAGAGGSTPFSGVIRDSSGNLYGTTFSGGGTGCGGTGCGVVYKVSPSGQETVLYTFTSEVDPWAGVIRDSAGNLYGATSVGGTTGGGVVYKLAFP